MRLRFLLINTHDIFIININNMSYYVKILDKKEKNANFEKHGSLRAYHKMSLFFKHRFLIG